MKTSKPAKRASAADGESSVIPKWEAKVVRLSHLRDIQKDDEIGIVIDILMNKYKWSYKKHSHRMYSSKEMTNVPLSNLKHLEDYFDTEDEIKAYVHEKFGWVGPKGKEYIPPSSKRIRKKAEVFEPNVAVIPQKRLLKVSSRVAKAPPKAITKNASAKTLPKENVDGSTKDTRVLPTSNAKDSSKASMIMPKENNIQDSKPISQVPEKSNSNSSIKKQQKVVHDLIIPTPIFSSNRITLQNAPSKPPSSTTLWV